MNQEKHEIRVEDYRRHLDRAVDLVMKRIAQVKNKHGVTYNTIKDYLEFNEPHILEQQKVIEEKCNSDILHRITNGEATLREGEMWKKHIEDWKQLFLESINLYEDYLLMANVA
ncbi:MAG: hypothetical protein GY863_00630 [bacterium]|nr:hypothetical protein [bacterium]